MPKFFSRIQVKLKSGDVEVEINGSNDVEKAIEILGRLDEIKEKKDGHSVIIDPSKT